MTHVTQIGLAGDWHGSFQWTRAALKTLGMTGVKQVFHAGDFSLGWPGKWPDLINIAERECKFFDMKLYVTPGNHENWEWINTREYDEDGLHWMTPHTAIMRRNAVIDIEYDGGTRRLLSLGGAASVDYTMRTEGIDWFREEVITLEEAEEAAAMTGIDIMVAHDAPAGGTDAVQKILDIPPHMSIFSEKGIIYANQSRYFIETAYHGAKPKVFAHGHFHAADMKQTDDTLFVSLGCNQQYNNLALLDLDTLEAKFIDLDERFLR